MKNSSGFTLTEAVTSFSILVIIITAVLFLHQSAANDMRLTRQTYAAQLEAERILQQILENKPVTSNYEYRVIEKTNGIVDINIEADIILVVVYVNKNISATTIGFMAP